MARYLGAQIGFRGMILWQPEIPEAPMSYFKGSQAKYVKKPHRVPNWSIYEAGLRNRGS